MKLHFIIISLLSVIFLSCDKPLEPGAGNSNLSVKLESSEYTLQGQRETLSLSFDNLPKSINGIAEIKLSLKYNKTVLSFQSASPGQFLEDCGWEYFTYRYGESLDSTTSIFEIHAIADTNNGNGNHPDCFDLSLSDISAVIAEIDFLVTNDRTYECTWVPIEFSFIECKDNYIISKDGSKVFLTSDKMNDCDPLDFTPDKELLRTTNFVNGGIDIICADSIDSRGDLNLNEIAFEIADAVLFADCFVYEDTVLSINYLAQLAATDVNADGLTLTVADFVYLVRVIIGDANPYPNNQINTPQTVNGEFSNANGTLIINNNLNIAAAHIVLEGNVTPTLLASNMDLRYYFDGSETNVFIYSLEGNHFTGSFLEIGSANIVSIEMADELGVQVDLIQEVMTVSLSQNYPNPFPTTTKIDFGIPVAQNVSLKIFDLQGKEKASYEAYLSAGYYTHEFDCSYFDAGNYFYRLTTENPAQTITKSMTLLK